VQLPKGLQIDGAYSVYVDTKIIFILRDRESEKVLNFKFSF